MAQQWRYLLPSILSILFVLISIYYHFSLIFVVLLLANFLNWKWGEFSSQELSETLKYFYSSRNARIIKTINALILFGFIFWSVTFVDRSNFSLIELIFFTVSIGIFTGCFIITLGHDLLHSRSFFHRALSTVFTISGIPHFATEHICGHHREVGLKEDPTTALQNGSFYTYFFLRLLILIFEISGFINLDYRDI
ncbi:MAG: fatty acid desaturase [Saprospiraceae bacterium]|nr:fatty acid desaturase [Candidatus Brachybacter algidus]